jgi:hypothetical protein
MASFEAFNETISPKDSGKRVESITVRLVVKNPANDGGEVGITDLMLQSGSISTVWSGHPSELRWMVEG